MKNKIEFISVWQWAGNDHQNTYIVHFKRQGSETRKYSSPSSASMRRFRDLLSYHAKGHQLSLVDNFIHIQAYPLE